MDVREALERLEEVHGRLARAEVYRGFRVPAVASVGLLGFLAAAVQPALPGTLVGPGFIWYWLVIGGLGAALGFGFGVRAYLFREDDFERQRTRRVMLQFAPCVLAGLAVAMGFLKAGPDQLPLLPGIWAILFGLGVVAVTPYLPPAVGWIGISYIAAGAVLLATVTTVEPSGWTVGGVFGVGHLATALALWRGEGDRDGGP